MQSVAEKGMFFKLLTFGPLEGEGRQDRNLGAVSEAIKTCQPNEEIFLRGGVDRAGGCGRCEPARNIRAVI